MRLPNELLIRTATPFAVDVEARDRSVVRFPGVVLSVSVMNTLTGSHGRHVNSISKGVFPAVRPIAARLPICTPESVTVTLLVEQAGMTIVAPGRRGSRYLAGLAIFGPVS
jgi:hypothetical protein